MDQLVVLVYLEYESVVDVVAPEDLHGKARTEQYETYHCREVVRVYARVQFIPVRLLARCLAYAEENEKGRHDEEPATEKRDHVGVFAANVVVLGIQLGPSLTHVSLAEAVSIERE